MQKIKIRSIGVILGLVGLCSFSSAEKITVQYVGDGNFFPGYCYARENGIWEDIVAYNENGVSQGVVGNSRDKSYQTMYCFSYTGYFLTSNGSNIASVYGDNLPRYIIPSSCPACEECETCPVVNTGAILSGSCDMNYCVENDLCPVPSNFSTLYINEIEHQSAPVINVSIPREYSRDSTVDSGEFNLVISGQNVDYEYIDGIVRTQKSKPNQIDFNNIVSGLMPLFIPGLVVILFIWFIFRFIKKIF